MSNFFLNIFIISFFIYLFNVKFYTYPRFLNIFIKKINLFVKNTYNIIKYYLNLFNYLFIILLFINIFGNFPFIIVPSNFYSFTITIRIILWLRLIIVSFIRIYDEIIRHLIPYGRPVGLIILLPLIEIISQILRPITLRVRISTNLAAGHIIIFIFSYFINLINNFISPFILGVILLLQILELGIRILQAYIFVTLIILYNRERIEML